MTDNTHEGSGVQNADDAPKDDRDYVITGEDDESEKAALAQKAEDEAEKQVDEDADDDGEEDEDDDEGEDDQSDEDSGKPRKRKRGGFQKKIARLEEEKEYWRQKALETPETKREKGKSSEKKAEDDTPKRPDPKDFETYDEYSEALTDWKVEEKLRKRDEDRQTEQKQSEFKAAQQSKVERYEEGIAEAQKLHDDFDEVIEDYDGPLTIGMQQALLDSDIGPQVAYYIAQHPKVGEKMAKMSILQINKEVAKIEARLERQQGDDEGAADKKTTKAPPPITPAKGTSKNKKSPDDQSYEEYLAEREKRRRSF